MMENSKPSSPEREGPLIKERLGSPAVRTLRRLRDGCALTKSVPRNVGTKRCPATLPSALLGI